MPSRIIGIVVAMRREVAPLLIGTRALHKDGVAFYELANAVVAVGGIGQRSAAKATEAVLAKYAPRMLVSAGIAGALTPQLKVGEVIRAHEVVDAETGVRIAMSGGAGTVVTVLAVSGEADKRSLAERWSADVVDMEAVAVAAVAQHNGVEFGAVKSISDELNFEMPPLGEFVNDSGKFETVRFAAFLAIRPKWWPAVRKLNANSRIAAVNLSDALRHLIEQRSHIDWKRSKVEAR